MRKTLCTVLGAAAVLSTMFVSPARAAYPEVITTVGAPIPPGCQNSVLAIVDAPAKRTGLDHPVQLTFGINVGTPSTPCGLTNLLLNADLYFLPVTGPATLVALGSAHGTCNVCNDVRVFGAATLPPGIYQVMGYVRTGSLTSTPLRTITGQRFLYDGLDITPI